MSENKIMKQNARLVIVKNPFQPWNGRIIKEITPGTKLRKELIGDANIGCDIYTSVNGKTVLIDDYEILGGEIITVSPVVGKGGGKGILGIIAMVALVAISVAVGNLAPAMFYNMGMSAGMALTMGYVSAMAVMFIGGSLISRAFYSQPKLDNTLTNRENEATYGWNGVQTLEGQNNAMQMTYGKVQSGGQTIGKFVEVLDNKEYLNWLIACGEGELEFSNILINDNDVSYYSGMELETRSGTNYQEPIKYFNDTYFTKSLGYQLLDTPRIDTAQGNGTQGLIVKIEFSNGLYYAQDDGNLGRAWVDISGKYRKKGNDNWTLFVGNANVNDLPKGCALNTPATKMDAGRYRITATLENVSIEYPNGDIYTENIEYGNVGDVGDFTIANIDWHFEPYYVDAYYDDDGYYIKGYWVYPPEFVVRDVTVSKNSVRISGAQSSALRREFRVDDLEQGEYEVSLEVTGRSHSVNSSRASVRCYWSSLTSIVYDDFSYPNTALIGVRALATDQISGSPTIKFLKERKNVWVYNTRTEQYEQRPANNPAWASYDMLHLASKLRNVNNGREEFEVRGVHAHSIIFEQFEEWAKFCEEREYFVNIEIGATEEMLNCINENIACIGHGICVRFGTRYGAVWYCKKQPVQMFGMGNIISGTFKEDFLETTSRANCLEITYIDADHDYSKETITIYGDNYDSDAVENATQVTFNGITSYKQAFREGKYQLFANKYQLRTVSFEANVDAIACTIGDVVLVAHDVPQWTHSGRIYDVDVENGTFRLPVELTSTSGNIRLMYRTINDNLYTVKVSVVDNKDGWCTVKGDIPNKGDLPQKGDVFDIGLTEIGSKPFVVTNITRAQDFTRNISGIEYIEALYDENYEIPPIQYSEATVTKPMNVTGLNASQIAYTDGFGVKKSRIFISWERPTNGGRFTVLLSKDGQAYEMIANRIDDTYLEADVDADTEYYIKVITTLGINNSTGTFVGPIAKGIDKLPPSVTALDTELLGDGTRRYFWSFEYPNPNDIAGFKMRYIQGATSNWNNGIDVQEGLIVTQPYETTTIMQGVHTIMIKAIDNAGQESPTFASCVVDFGDPLEDNVLWKGDYLKNLDVPYWNSADSTHFDKPTDFYWSKIKTNGEKRNDGYIYSKQTNTFWTLPRRTHFENANVEYWSESYSEFSLDTVFYALASGYFYMLYEVQGAYNLSYKIDGKDDIYKPYSTKVYVSAGDIIKVHFEAYDNGLRTVLKKLIGVIDVPDRQEHFENISISQYGTELPIITPHYHTTAVAIDSISVSDEEKVAYFEEHTKTNPCVVKIYKVSIKDGALVKEYIDCVADITWQGFIKETIKE